VVILLLSRFAHQTCQCCMHKISRFHPGIRKFVELLESENTWEQITRKAIRNCDLRALISIGEGVRIRLQGRHKARPEEPLLKEQLERRPASCKPQRQLGINADDPAGDMKRGRHLPVEHRQRPTGVTGFRAERRGSLARGRLSAWFLPGGHRFLPS